MSDLYAVGDIHGRLDKLDALLDALPLAEGDRLLFLGDYVDRGPDSAGVVDRLIALAEEWPCVFLLGNHEAMFLDFLGWRGPHYMAGDSFLANGGVETLQSYGCLDLYSVEQEGLVLPPGHAAFFEELVLYHREGPYLFVHAGLGSDAMAQTDVERALEGSPAEELVWRRLSGHERHELGVTIVYGHTPHRDFEVRWNLPWGIGIDTGAVYGGPLTALRLPDETLVQV